MPIGGIGTGSVAIAGDGSLRQWQLRGPGNHAGFVPDSFFAIRSSSPGRGDIVKLLESVPAPDDPSAPSSSDGTVPKGLRERQDVIAPMARSRIRAAYPVAEVAYNDPDVPVEVSLQAFNPFAPLDEAASTHPAALFQFRLRNPTSAVLTGWLAGSLQNSTGWDGVSPISGTRAIGYGGATNRRRRSTRSGALVMSNATLPSEHAAYGQLVLACDQPDARAIEQFASTADFAAFLRGCYLLDHHLPATDRAAAGTFSRSGVVSASGISTSGSTWNGALAIPYRLEPGESTTIRFWISWWFPNRFIDFVQFGEAAVTASPAWLGNHYSTVFADAVEVSDGIAEQWTHLASITDQWLNPFRALAPLDAEHLTAQAATLRSPSVFRTPDGRLFGFEGVQGASTGSWADHGGSCPLNCNHVWNYEQALARLFPRLELTMRDTEFDVSQAPDGSIPHRVIVPVQQRQPWNGPVGGPVDAALDGMLGTVLKSLREMQQGAGIEWLDRRWPALLRLLEHIRGRWQSDSGTLIGSQPSTFDIPLHGLNPYIGTLWLCALRALERLAEIVDDDMVRRGARDTFDSAATEYDRELYNGEYFEQQLGPRDPVVGSWGAGCLSDQLVGQWWAHQLGLGHLLPPDHVRAALRSIVRYNFRRNFTGHQTAGRVFADGLDAGLLNCTWPRGGQPADPVWYHDEVWSGIELQVAAHLAFERLDEESRTVSTAVWTRYDGRRRNPFNHVECGDHYVRSMAGFSLIEARAGVRLDATAGGLIDLGGPEGNFPIFGGGMWGTAVRSAGIVTFHSGTDRPTVQQ